jgi:hypothetical protein
VSFPEYPNAQDFAEPWGEASDRGGTDIDTLIVHCAVGSFPGFMQYLQRTPNVSCHYGVARDGRIGQGVSERWGAFHAGTKHWNLRSLGIEHDDGGNCEKQPWMTEAMFDASTKLAAHLCKKYSIGPERIIPHREIATDNRSCPGKYFDLVAYRDQVSRLLSPSKPPSKPVLYRCIAGTFKARSGANRRVSELRGKGFEAALVFEAGYFRVLAGSFRERAGADQRVKALKAKRLEAYVLPTVADAPKESNMDKAIAYALNFRGAPYVWWANEQQNLGEGPPAWAVDRTAPDPLTVRQRGLFCMAVMNLMLRKLGKPVPKNAPYDGGTGAYRLVYGSKMRLFALSEVERGDLLFRPYRSVQDQGHGAVALGGPDEKVLQSFATSFGTTYPGCNTTYTARQSHDGGYYRYLLKAKDWLG